MKTLVLCVDRDDDFGEKAGLTSPIVGRKDNLRAVISLGLIDPEDSDTNSLFASIKTYDELVENDEDAEIATICGNKEVGSKSDKELGDQLDAVIEDLEPDRLIFVSDGGEDEFILPIIESRIKIDAVKRIIVRQQKSIEGSVYFVAKALQDEKIRIRFVVPLALIFLVFGLFNIAGQPGIGIGAIFFTLGIYLLIRAMHLEDPVVSIGKDFRDALQHEKYISAFSLILAIFVILWGLSLGYVEAIKETDLFFIILQMVEHSFWWIILAGIIYTLGDITDIYIRTGKFASSFWYIIFSLFATGFILWALIEIFRGILGENYQIDVIFLNVLAGGFLGFLAVIIHNYIKGHFESDSGVSEWRR
jgi:putative membrane protein